MKYYLVVGERSGDQHASNLMKQILLRDPEAEFRFYGGEYMKEVGGHMVRYYGDMAFMGIWEVAKNLRKIKGYMKECKEDISAWNPDVVILVDFSGFNLKIAKYTKEQGLKTFYYISPKVWVWNTKRAHKIKQYVDRMFVILPFEKDFYKQYDYHVDYVGNPVLDSIREHPFDSEFLQKNNLQDKPVIAILPGSRKQEIEKMLDFFAQITKGIDKYHFVIAAVPTYPAEYFEMIAKKYGVSVVYNQTYDLLKNSTAAMVVSGTATLETAVIGVPQVVCYKTSWLTYVLAKWALKVDYISLVNLIANKLVVKEFIQGDCTHENVKSEILNLSGNEEYRQEVSNGYKNVMDILGQKKAAENAAELMVKYLKEG